MPALAGSGLPTQLENTEKTRKSVQKGLLGLVAGAVARHQNCQITMALDNIRVDGKQIMDGLAIQIHLVT